jgi:hypothetical protein
MVVGEMAGSIPQGLKPLSFCVERAKAEALAYLEAETKTLSPAKPTLRVRNDKQESRRRSLAGMTTRISNSRFLCFAALRSE